MSPTAAGRWAADPLTLLVVCVVGWFAAGLVVWLATGAPGEPHAGTLLLVLVMAAATTAGIALSGST